MHGENPTHFERRSVRRRARIAAGLLLCLQLTACTAFPAPVPPESPSEPEPDEAAEVREICERVDASRNQQLELEMKRLRADLRDAEESMIAIESGLIGVQGRADAVSAIAETRIEIARAARNAPWSVEGIAEAGKKLAEAERQFQRGRSGSAVFFASRARRIANGLNDEARRVARTPGAGFVNGKHVNLRAGPSLQDAVIDVLLEATPVFRERRDGEWLMVRTLAGRTGWIHASLVGDEPSVSSQTQTQSLPASLAR